MSLKAKAKAKVTGLVEFVADHMKFRVVESFSSWICLKGKRMLKTCFAV